MTLREPTPGQLRLFEAVLVALADHGFTPTAIAARLTYYSAPDALQGALAAGLLGGGSRFLGVTEDTGRFLSEVIASVDGSLPDTETGWDTVARHAVQQQRAAGRFVPGLGHPVHKHGDPRVPVIEGIARDEGVAGPHLALFAAIGRVPARSSAVRFHLTAPASAARHWPISDSDRTPARSRIARPVRRPSGPTGRGTGTADRREGLHARRPQRRIHVALAIDVGAGVRRPEPARCASTRAVWPRRPRA